MTDCSSYNGSISSDIPSSRGSNSRIRVLRLIRAHSDLHSSLLIDPLEHVTLGFSLRGGREFGTGFFVSKVEKGSEADMKGMRVADQIIRVNGYHVDDATHKELIQFISNQNRVTFKVRGVGIIPVKERSLDPLTWHVVPSKKSIKPYETIDDVICRDVRIIINVAPRAKLGCGICKGPECKPGIFVQFTKDGGIARESGLRPGDQLLSCNGIDFADILFSEAVAIMKSSHTLELLVRTGAGLDLFPSESSGYNSSASSVTGDQSPCWADQNSKRLSIVREESSSSREDKRGQFWLRNNGEPVNFDKKKEKLRAVESPKVPTSYTTKTAPSIPERSPPKSTIIKPANNNNNNKTIIQLYETGTFINNTLVPIANSSSLYIDTKQNGNDTNLSIKQNNTTINNTEQNFRVTDYATPRREDSTKIADICFKSQQTETKTVTVEVHRNPPNRIPPPPPPKCSESNKNTSSITTSSNFESPPTPCSSLSSAISDELKRRAASKINGTTTNTNIENKLNSSKFGNPIGHNNQQHSALMNEFKKAHKRMFKKSVDGTEGDMERQDEIRKTLGIKNNNNSQNESVSMDRDTPDNAGLVKHSNGNTLLTSIDCSPPTPIPDYDSTPQNTIVRVNGQHNKTQSHINNSNGITIITQKYANNDGRPIKGTMGRIAAASELARAASAEAAELESIESYKMTTPASTTPRPPSVYFAPQKSGPPTMKKSNRSVSVTIGEYGGGTLTRKEPHKFDFITKPGSDQNEREYDVTTQLKHELEKTLSRSNLKKRSDSMDNLLNLNKSPATLNGNGLSNGVRSPSTEALCRGAPVDTNHSKSILKKTQSANIEKLSSMLIKHQMNLSANDSNNNNYNNIIINGNNSKNELKKTESTPINGILRNGNYSSNEVTTKTISFKKA